MSETRSTPTQGKHPRRALFELGLGLLLSLAMSGCGINGKSGTSPAFIGDCILDAEQGGTLSGRWLKTGVPIAFQNAAFSPAEIQAMVAAAKTWNTFYAASMPGVPNMQFPTIDYGSDASPRMSTVPLPTNSTDFCNNVAPIVDSTKGFAFGAGNAITIYRDNFWPAAYGTAVIALTTTCRQSATGRKIPYFSNGYMELNYVNFFTGANAKPDIQSILLHEFGHLMGINHSCEVGSVAAGIPDCHDPELPKLYRTASLYPTFSFFTGGIGETRQSLNNNDEGRMNCVYKFL